LGVVSKNVKTKVLKTKNTKKKKKKTLQKKSPPPPPRTRNKVTMHCVHVKSNKQDLPLESCTLTIS